MVRKRKSPIRHHVKSHTRRGFHGRYGVNDYMRGHGHHSLSPFIRRRVLDQDKTGRIYCPVEGKTKDRHCLKCSQPETSNSHEKRLYTVVFGYEGGRSEVVKTVARSPQQAMRYGMIRRQFQGVRPTKVVVKNITGIEIAAIAVPATIAAIGIAIPLISQFLKRPKKEQAEVKKAVAEYEPKIRALVEREIQKELERRQKAEATTPAITEAEKKELLKGTY